MQHMRQWDRPLRQQLVHERGVSFAARPRPFVHAVRCISRSLCTTRAPSHRPLSTLPVVTGPPRYIWCVACAGTSAVTVTTGAGRAGRPSALRTSPRVAAAASRAPRIGHAGNARLPVSLAGSGSARSMPATAATAPPHRPRDARGGWRSSSSGSTRPVLTTSSTLRSSRSTRPASPGAPTAGAAPPAMRPTPAGSGASTTRVRPALRPSAVPLPCRASTATFATVLRLPASPQQLQHPAHTRAPCPAAVLGPDSKTPHGAVEGMPLQDMITAWDLPFASDNPATKGCPALKP